MQLSESDEVFAATRPSEEEIDKILDEIEVDLCKRRSESLSYIEMFGPQKPSEEVFEDLVVKARKDAKFLLEEVEPSEMVRIGNRLVLSVNEGGMGTGTSGPHLAKAILEVGGLARLSSIGGGRYHPDKNEMQNNSDGIRELYRRLNDVFTVIAKNTGVEDINVLYELLDLTLPEKALKMADGGRKLSGPVHFKLMDVLTLAENILVLKKIPNESGRGMLGVNIMKKTEGYRRMAILVALAFSGDCEGERSEGLLTLSAGVADDIVQILKEAKQKIPGLQIPRMDHLISLGAPAEAILKASEDNIDTRTIPKKKNATAEGEEAAISEETETEPAKWDSDKIYPDMFTFENPVAGGHLGAKRLMIPAYERERKAAKDGLTTAGKPAGPTAPEVIKWTLGLMKKYNINIPLSLAGSYNMDPEEQARLIRIVEVTAEELRIPVPQIAWQLGTPYSVALDGDANADFKITSAAAKKNDNPALTKIREKNRLAFQTTLVNCKSAFQEFLKEADPNKVYEEIKTVEKVAAKKKSELLEPFGEIAARIEAVKQNLKDALLKLSEEQVRADDPEIQIKALAESLQDPNILTKKRELEAEADAERRRLLAEHYKNVSREVMIIESEAKAECDKLLVQMAERLSEDVSMMLTGVLQNKKRKVPSPEAHHIGAECHAMITAIMGRIGDIDKALTQFEKGADTIVFTSTAGDFEARGVPTEDLARIIAGIQIRTMDCVNCLSKCSYADRDEIGTRIVDGITKADIRAPEGDTPVYTFSINGIEFAVAARRFCIEEVLQKDKPETGMLVFRGDGEVPTDEPKPAVVVTADAVRQVRVAKQIVKEAREKALASLQNFPEEGAA